VLLTRKPFKVGEFIEAQGVAGTVTAVDMFMTTLLSPDNKVPLIVTKMFSVTALFFVCAR
jgi:small conductance mechanosensitive channel